MGEPAFDLKDIRALIRSGDFRVTSSSMECVQDALGVTADRAQCLILEQVEMLTPRNYSETLPPQKADGTPADVYAVFAERRGWYIKVAVRHGRLIVISFHLPERPIRTADGWVKGSL